MKKFDDISIRLDITQAFDRPTQKCYNNRKVFDTRSQDIEDICLEMFLTVYTGGRDCCDAQG